MKFIKNMNAQKVSNFIATVIVRMVVCVLLLLSLLLVKFIFGKTSIDIAINVTTIMVLADLIILTTTIILVKLNTKK